MAFVDNYYSGMAILFRYVVIRSESINTRVNHARITENLRAFSNSINSTKLKTVS